MPEVLDRQSALSAAQQAARGVRLAERSDLGKIDLRGDPSDRDFVTAVGRCLDVLLPTEPNSSAQKGSITVLWLGPDEWLITCPATDQSRHMDSLIEALGHRAAITDLTDARVVIRVAGPNARDVLAKGCPLDLHPRVFLPGSSAQSLLAKAAALIHLTEDEAFDVYVARSFAQYLWTWLEDAGLEYGLQVEASATAAAPPR